MIFKSHLLVAVCACIVFVSLSANAAFTYDIAAFIQVFFYSSFAPLLIGVVGTAHGVDRPVVLCNQTNGDGHLITITG